MKSSQSSYVGVTGFHVGSKTYFVFVKLWPSLVDIKDFQGLGLFKIREEVKSLVVIVLTHSGLLLRHWETMPGLRTEETIIVLYKTGSFN